MKMLMNMDLSKFNVVNSLVACENSPLVLVILAGLV